MEYDDLVVFVLLLCCFFSMFFYTIFLLSKTWNFFISDSVKKGEKSFFSAQQNHQREVLSAELLW